MFANSPCSSVPSHRPFGWDTRKALSAPERHDERTEQQAHSKGDRSRVDAIDDLRRSRLRDVGREPSRQAEKYSAPVIVRRNNLMQPEFTHSTTLRWTLLVAGTLAAFIVALLGFVYLKTKDDLTMRSDRVIASQIGVFAELPPERSLDAIDEHLKQDPARVQLAGWFDSNRRRIAGNLESLLPDLKTDNAVLSAVVGRADESGREKQAVRLIARSPPDGDVLVIGRWRLTGDDCQLPAMRPSATFQSVLPLHQEDAS
jgi:hypothetical protein